MKGKLLGFKDATQEIAVELPTGDIGFYEIPDKEVYEKMKLESEFELKEREQ